LPQAFGHVAVPSVDPYDAPASVIALPAILASSRKAAVSCFAVYEKLRAIGSAKSS
jgi:hypothetical protein